MQELLDKLGVNINVAFHLIFVGLIWVRCLMMASVVPFLFGKPVPRYVVVGTSMVLAFYAYPHLVPAAPPHIADPLNLVMLFLKEIFYGLILGFSASVIFYAFEGVGQMIDNQRGVSIARLIIPQLGEMGSISGSFLLQFSIVLYLAIGGHRQFLEAFFGSYRALPVLEYPVIEAGMVPLLDLFVRITGELFFVAIQLAAPVIIAIFIADIILGIANRIAPQINVWELGFNVKGFVGILLLAVSITMIADQMEKYTLRSTEHVTEAIGHLQKKIPPPKLPELPPEEGLLKPEKGPPPVTNLPQ
ncbi:MAG: flagellar biosynthetic protein FliR [Deltaproteobacteria bacterium]|nr:flagellar biosynthetic protein FliR [Deltaproteobacteria bacterium]